jgi:hypothetical protein
MRYPALGYRPVRAFSPMYFTSRSSENSASGTIPIAKEVDALSQTIDEFTSDMDAITHRIQDWDIWVKALLQNIEFYAMANDADHPQQFLGLLNSLREGIEYRITHGEWSKSE